MGVLQRMFGGEVDAQIADSEKKGGYVGPSPETIAAMSLPANAFELPGGHPVEIVGESSYLSAFEAFFGRRCEAGVRLTVRVNLIPEHDNPYDTNAISARLGGRVVGYIGRQVAPTLRPFLEEVESSGRVAVCTASVRGGWDRGNGDTGDYGVTLDIADPVSLGVALQASSAS